MSDTRTAKEMWELYEAGDVKEVQSSSDTSYRHGTYEHIVLEDKDGRYWAGSYTLSGDGEHNEWRDDNSYMSPFVEVFQHKEVKEVVSYRVKGNEK